MRAPLAAGALTLTVALSASNASAQQQPSLPTLPRDQRPVQQTGTGVIRGRVVAADTNAPLRRVQIHLTPMTAEVAEPRLTMTDDEGRYEFTQLLAGRYGLKASKGGYVAIEYGQRRPFEKGRPIDVADRQVLERVDMVLPLGAVVTGRVTDETGEPVAGAWVQLARYQYFNGKRRLIGNYGDSTDDRGEFRVFGIPPAEYVLSATLGGGERSTDKVRYVQTFYPGTTSRDDAQRVRVKIGGELSGLTIALMRQRTASVSGVVRMGTAPFSMVMAQRTDGLGSDTRDSIVDSRGAFSITGLLPGVYLINAQSFFGNERASVEVKVDAVDVTGVVLTMSAGAAARGQVRFEGGAPPRDLQPSQVMLFAAPEDDSSSSEMPRPSVRGDWTFELTGIHGRQFLTGVALKEWRVSKVSIAGNDFTDVPIDFSSGDVNGIEVTLSNQHTEVAGQVTDIRGVVVGDTTVIIFTADPEKWTAKRRYIEAARPDQQGRYHIEGLPAGRYLAIAVDYLEDGEEQDPDRLKEWARLATSVTLGDGEKRVLDLKVVSTN